MHSIATASLQWVKRDNSQSNDNDIYDPYCTGWCASNFVRWVIAAIIIVAIVVFSVILWVYSIRRATGFWALTARQARQRALQNGNLNTYPNRDLEASGYPGRGRRRNRRRHNNQAFEADADPVPTYYPTPGDGDAGHYDENGNYMAYEPPPYEPPKAVLRVSTIEPEDHDLYELDQYQRGNVSEEFESNNRGSVRRHH